MYLTTRANTTPLLVVAYIGILDSFYFLGISSKHQGALIPMLSVMAEVTTPHSILQGYEPSANTAQHSIELDP